MPLTIFQQNHHAAGNAPDTTPLQLEFNPPCMVIDVAIFDFAALVSFSSDGVFFSSEREFAAGIIASLNQYVASVRIRNKTAASVARYDITGFYSPIEVVGAEFRQRVKT